MRRHLLNPSARRARRMDLVHGLSRLDVQSRPRMDSRTSPTKQNASDRPMHPKIVEGLRTNFQIPLSYLRDKSRKSPQQNPRSNPTRTRRPTTDNKQSADPSQRRRPHPSSAHHPGLKAPRFSKQRAVGLCVQAFFFMPV